MDDPQLANSWAARPSAVRDSSCRRVRPAARLPNNEGGTVSTGTSAMLARLKDDSGMSTAEYAVGTVAACGFGGLLVKLLSSPQVFDLLWKSVEKAFGSIL